MTFKGRSIIVPIEVEDVAGQRGALGPALWGAGKGAQAFLAAPDWRCGVVDSLFRSWLSVRSDVA